MSLVKRVALLITLGLGFLQSALIWAELLPNKDFLIVTSSGDTLGDYHARFAAGSITSNTFQELVIAMNPSAISRSVGPDEKLMAGQVLTLPGQNTLQSFSAAIKLGVNSKSETVVMSEQKAVTHYNAIPGKRVQDDYVVHTPSNQNNQPGASTSQTYTVNYGDTLLGLAIKYRVDMLHLAQTNNLDAPYRLVAGQTLIISVDEPNLSSEMRETPIKMPSAIEAPSWVESGDNPISSSGRRGTSDSAQHLPSGDDKTVANHLERGYLNTDEALLDATSHSEVSHSDHFHELLLPTAFVMFCMSEEDASAVLTDVRQSFDGAYSTNEAGESYVPIIEYLKDRGYLRAKIHADRGGRAMFLASGPRFRVAAQKIRPRHTVAGRGDRHPTIALPINEFYSPQLEQQLATVAAEWLAEQGYPLADVSDLQKNFDNVLAEVNFHLAYDSSRDVQISAVDQNGANALTHGQLHTLSPFSEDNRYSQSALDQLRSRLMATGYYKSLTFELLEDADASASSYRIEVSATPAKTKRLKADLAYSQGQGTLLLAELLLPNMTGHEDDAAIRANVDDSLQQIVIDYQRRNLGWYGFDAGLSGHIDQQDQPYFSGKSMGLSLLGVWHGSDRLDDQSWRVSLDWRQADERRVSSLMDKRFEYGRLAIGRSGRGTGLFHFVSHYSLNIAHANSFTTDADDYWSLDATTDWVLPAPLGRRFEMRLGTDFRYADDLSTLPFSAQLYHGGVSSNRGYEAATFSSLDLNAESAAYRVYTQIEMPWDVNFHTPWISKVIPFIDLSVLGADGHEANQTFSSIGLGLAGNVAGYPYRVDLAQAVDGQASNGLLLNFSVGLNQ